MCAGLCGCCVFIAIAIAILCAIFVPPMYGGHWVQARDGSYTLQWDGQRPSRTKRTTERLSRGERLSRQERMERVHRDDDETYTPPRYKDASGQQYDEL